VHYTDFSKHYSFFPMRFFVTFSGWTATVTVKVESEEHAKNLKEEAKMHSKKALTFMVAVTLVLVFTAASAEARPYGPHMQKRGMGPGSAGLRAFHDLKLSDAQQESITKIINQYQDQRETLRDSMVMARRNLRVVLQAELFNEEEARKAFREASAVREDMFVLRAKMMTELRAVLTPEQLELIKERKAKRIERMKKRFGAWSEKQSQ
jgi:Spy/CpxP family protein refolding chaperone